LLETPNTTEQKRITYAKTIQSDKKKKKKAIFKCDFNVLDSIIQAYSSNALFQNQVPFQSSLEREY
jgi:hypothetical protein